MDYDRWDALLHHIFKQTQGDAWFRPNEAGISSGVALRILDAPPEFRVFPYEEPSLEPFEAAVKALNPVVAVKVRSAAVHAALAELPPHATSLDVDYNTRIQVLESIYQLPAADKDQLAAFVRDERVMVVWADSLDAIIPTCADFDDRLIKLLWRSRPGVAGSTTSSSFISGLSTALSHAPSISDGHAATGSASSHGLALAAQTTPPSRPHKRTWYGRKIPPTTSSPDRPEKRKAALYAPLYNGLAAGLAFVFIGNGVRILLSEVLLDQHWLRFALCSLLPLLFCVSLFFALQIIQNVTMAIGPIAHYHANSLYYSARPPPPAPPIDNHLPHITIQMPVYKESLQSVLAPSIRSIKRAMQTYARQGGSSSILVCDDGMRLIGRGERDERIAFYATHDIAWVARPRHGCPPASALALAAAQQDAFGSDPEKGGSGSASKTKRKDKSKGKEPAFVRPGRFKKASNMNYALALSLRLEKHLEEILSNTPPRPGQFSQFSGGGQRNSTGSVPSATGGGGGAGVGTGQGQYGLQYMNKDGDDMGVGILGAEAPAPSQSQSQSHSSSSSGSAPGSGHAYPPPPSTPTALAQQPASSSPPIPDDPVEHALLLALASSYAATRYRWAPWAANARGMRVGEIILLVDSDTVVPEDCLRDAAREMGADPTVAIIQHESDVMQVAGHYFENAIAYFTRRINRCISMACANGEVAPFVGHNAFLRWRALQDAAFPVEGETHSSSSKKRNGEREKREGEEEGLTGGKGTVGKIWSESNVSEDFDMALRLLRRGYIVRWATYSDGGFKEGVSLTVDDELNRWQKYAYGCSEMLFNPLYQWFTKGPIQAQIHRFIWSSAPLHYKISMMAYMFSYYGIAASMTIGIINYVLLGFMLPVDNFYMHSFEIWLATTVVFFGSGNVGYTLLEYRLGKKDLVWGFLENLKWIPFFFFFFGGLAIPVSQAILAHLFSYDISWAATIKEVERSNFFKEIPKIFKRFWFSLLLSFVVLAGMVVVSTPLVPIEWRVDGSAWAVIFPLAVVVSCHLLFPIVLNPWLMVFSY